MNIQVTSLKPANVPGQPNLRGFAEIKVGEITICDCRIIQQPGQRAYVSGPQKQVGTAFYPIVKMSSALKEKVQAVVLDAATRARLIQPLTPAMPDNRQFQAGDLLAAIQSDGPGH